MHKIVLYIIYKHGEPSPHQIIEGVHNMKFTNIEDVNAFLAVVDQCKGEVYLKSDMGDQFALKSKFSRYIAMGALLSEHGDELELFCEYKEDEPLLLKFLSDNQHVL